MSLAERVPDRPALPRRIDSPLRLLTAPLSALSFWSAIALPALYVPLMVAGIDTTRGLLLFLGLIGLHLLALFGGRSYASE